MIQCSSVRCIIEQQFLIRKFVAVAETLTEFVRSVLQCYVGKERRSAPKVLGTKILDNAPPGGRRSIWGSRSLSRPKEILAGDGSPRVPTTS